MHWGVFCPVDLRARLFLSLRARLLLSLRARLLLFLRGRVCCDVWKKSAGTNPDADPPVVWGGSFYLVRLLNCLHLPLNLHGDNR